MKKWYISTDKGWPGEYLLVLLFILTYYFFLNNMLAVKTWGLPRSRIFRIFVFIMTAFFSLFITERCSRWIVAIWIEGRSLAEISECTEEPFPERVRNGLAKVKNEDLKFAIIFVMCTIVYAPVRAMHQTWEKCISDMNWEADSDENVRLTPNDVALNRLYDNEPGEKTNKQTVVF